MITYVEGRESFSSYNTGLIFLNRVWGLEKFIFLLHLTSYIFSIFVFQAKKWTSLNDMLTHLGQTWVCFLHARDSLSFGKDKDTVPGLTAITPSVMPRQRDIPKDARLRRRIFPGLGGVSEVKFPFVPKSLQHL